MRKFEQRQNIENIKRMAIAGWPITVDEKGILYANMSVYVLEDDQVYDWRNLFEYEVKILDPEIPLKEARERIKSGVVYFFSDEGFSYKVFTIGDIQIQIQDIGVCKIMNDKLTLYPFDPTPCADLLEEVEEEKEKRPRVRRVNAFQNAELEYINEHFNHIYARIEALEGKN